MKFEFSHLFSEAWYASMSSENIVSSFRTTGICPFNRHALNHVPGMEKEESHLLHPKNLAEITGLSTYLCVVHLHAMLNLNLIVRVIIALQFQLYLTGSQLQCYNYSDYELPEKVVPPPDTLSARFHREGSVPLRTSTSVSNFFNPPIPPSKIPTKNKKSCGNCLTSTEGLRRIQQKENEKEEKEKLKQERKEEREKKAKA